MPLIVDMISDRLTRVDIESYQLNRGSFLLLDEAWAVVPGKSGQAVVDLSGGHWVFKDHFPGNPIFPGSLMIEAITQLCGLVMCCRPGKRSYPIYTTKVFSCSFKGSATIGDKLVLGAEVIRFGRGVVHSKGKISKEKNVIAQGEFQLVSVKEFGEK